MRYVGSLFFLVSFLCFQSVNASFVGNPELKEVFAVSEGYLGPIGGHSCDWIDIDGKTFLAIGLDNASDSILRLYEYSETGDRLFEVFKVDPSVIGTSGEIRTVRWQSIVNSYGDTEHYLAVGGDYSGFSGNTHPLRLYQYFATGDRLREVYKVPLSTFGSSPFAIAHQVDWLFLNGEYYVAVGADDAIGGGHYIQIYRYNESGARLARVVAIEDVYIFNDVNAVQWSPRKSGSFFYLASGGLNSLLNDSDLRLWFFEDNPSPGLIQVQSINITESRVHAVSWHEVGGTLYLAALGLINNVLGSGVEDLRLYKLDESSFPSVLVEVDRVAVTTFSTPIGGNGSLDWRTICNQHFLSVAARADDTYGSGNEDLRLYKLNVGLEKLEEIFKVPEADFAGEGVEVRWHEVGDEFFLAAIGFLSGSDLRLYSFPIQDADLLVIKTVSDVTPVEGDTITYTVTVTNNGPDDLTSVEVMDSLPAGVTFVSSTPSQGSYSSGTGIWFIGSLTSGTTETLMITVTVDSGTVGMSIINTASVMDAYGGDPYLESNTATATIVPRERTSDLVIMKTVSNTSPTEGDTITYTVTVTNNGPDDLVSVEVLDSLPVGVTFVSSTPSAGSYSNGSGVWFIGGLVSGAVETLVITVTVNGGTAGMSIVNTASVADAYITDPYLESNAKNVTIIPKEIVNSVQSGSKLFWAIEVSDTEACNINVT